VGLRPWRGVVLSQVREIELVLHDRY
jgi:hypothetical protein